MALSGSLMAVYRAGELWQGRTLLSDAPIGHSSKSVGTPGAVYRVRYCGYGSAVAAD